MGRKDVRRFISIETRIDKLEERLQSQIEDHKRLIQESKESWKVLRFAITNIIERD